MTVAARYVAVGAKGATALIVANALGAAGAGTFALIRILPHVTAGLLGLGVTIAIPYLIGGRKYAAQTVTETVVALGLLLSVVGWTAWWISGDFLHAHYYTKLSAGAVLFVGAMIPLVLLRNYLNSIQQGLQQFKGANVVLLAEEFGELLCVLPLLWVADSVSSTTLIVVAGVSGAAASCLTAVIMLVRHGIRPWPRLHWEIAVESIRFGLKGHVGRMANMLNWRLDALILSTLASVEVVGYYAVASQVA
jgi:O-antigen/teichoic acid export membrane protein